MCYDAWRRRSRGIPVRSSLPQRPSYLSRTIGAILLFIFTLLMLTYSTSDLPKVRVLPIGGLLHLAVRVPMALCTVFL
ncbi:hypothetical protein E2C01_022882 [Portunus trituberculatus]|uniref:Uncharacterized protein n=1 Tax=Portunus trituberculatus TaxID=210409 RepID=A0A5B7E7C1_PORTR|nr:hypothetical protein [Portunus trituberculatus]